MAYGFIKIHRKIWDNAVAKKPNYLVVWLYLISHANHKDKDIIINDKKITIKRGSFIGSMRKISKHFKISISTVFNIVKYLKAEHMIEHEPNANYSLFTILNYDEYQKVEHPIEHEPNTSRTRAETTKKEKNYKNDKNKKKEKKGKKKFSPPTLKQVEDYCFERKKGIDANKWINHYTSNGWKVGKNKMVDWKSAVRTWETNTFSKKNNNPNREVL